jgi:hypothetical protein
LARRAAAPLRRHWDLAKDKDALDPFHGAEYADDKEDFAILRGAYFLTPEEELSRRENIRARGNGSGARAEVLRGKRKVRRRRRNYQQNIDKQQKEKEIPRFLSREQLLLIFKAFDPGKLLHTDNFLDYVNHSKLIGVLDRKYGKVNIEKVLVNTWGHERREIAPSGGVIASGGASRTIVKMRRKHAAQSIQHCWRAYRRQKALLSTVRKQEVRKPLVQINRNPRVMTSGNFSKPSALSTLGQDLFYAAEPAIRLEANEDERFLNEVLEQKKELHKERARQRKHVHDAEQKARSPTKARRHRRHRRHRGSGGSEGGAGGAGAISRAGAISPTAWGGDNSETQLSETSMTEAHVGSASFDGPQRTLLQEASFLFLLALSQGMHLPIYFPPAPVVVVTPQNISEFAEYWKGGGGDAEDGTGEIDGEGRDSKGGEEEKEEEKEVDFTYWGSESEEEEAAIFEGAPSAAAAAGIASRAATAATTAATLAVSAATSEDAADAALVALDRDDHRANRSNKWYKCVQIQPDEKGKVVSVEQLYRCFLTFVQLSEVVKIPGDGDWDAQKQQIRATKPFKKRAKFEVGIESFHYNGLPKCFQGLRQEAKFYAADYEFKGTKHEERISWKYSLPHRNTLLRLLKQDQFELLMAHDDARRERLQQQADGEKWRECQSEGRSLTTTPTNLPETCMKRGDPSSATGTKTKREEYAELHKAPTKVPKKPPSEIYTAEMQTKANMLWRKEYHLLMGKLLPAALPQWDDADVEVDVDRDWCCASCDRGGFMCPCPCCGHCHTCSDGRADHDLQKWKEECEADAARQERRKKKGLRISIDMGKMGTDGAAGKNTADMRPDFGYEGSADGGTPHGEGGERSHVTLARRVQRVLSKAKPCDDHRGDSTPFDAFDVLSVRSRGSLAHIFRV